MSIIVVTLGILGTAGIVFMLPKFIKLWNSIL